MVLGAHNLTDQSEDGRKTAKIKIITIHEKWNSQTKNFEHDVALTRLSRKVPFDKFISPIAINPTLEMKEFGKVAGWNENGTLTDVATVTGLNTMANADCLEKNENLTGTLGQDTFFAVKSHGSVSPISSGSGLYHKIDGITYLQGIVSSTVGEKCSENEIVIFSDVAKNYDFIEVNFF